MAMSPFIWGQGGQKLTPEQVARKRELADAAAGRAGNTSPVGHWSQGATRVVDALGGVLNERRADKGEAAGMSGADDYIANNPVLASLIGSGGSGVSMGVPATAPMSAMTSPDQQVASDTMDVLGASGHDHASHAGQSHSDWLQYNNQGATRNKPLDDKLVSALSFLPDLGVSMRVISGGQDGKGEGDRRTGSTRHDHGGAADADFYKDGRKLDWNNPDDVPIFQEIVKRARANGVTGIGAGDDYMGPGRMHIGFGSEAVWGPGGSSANAPEWLRAAYGGAPVTAQTSYSPQGGGVPQQDNSGVIQALAGAMSDPWVAKKYGPVIEAMMGQQMKRGDMQYQQQLAQQDPYRQLQIQQAQLDLEQDRTGAGGDVPSSVQELQWRAKQAGLEPGTPEYQSFVLNGGGDPATFRSLDMQAQAAGLQPGTPEYAEFMGTRGAGLQAGARTTGENMADIATGGEAARVVSAGSAQGSEEGKATAAGIAGAPAEIAQAEQGIALIDSIINDPALPKITGMIQGNLPPMSQGGVNLNVKIKQLQGKAFLEAFESLKGGGAITEREGLAAQNAMARLDRAQSVEAYTEALNELKGIMETGRARAMGRGGEAAQFMPKDQAMQQGPWPIDNDPPPDGWTPDDWKWLSPEERSSLR